MTVADFWPVSPSPTFSDPEAPLHPSHAHPRPQTPKSMNQQVVRELLDNIDVDVILKGILGATKSTATDEYCPEVRRSETNRHHYINHLDIVSCWKGLSLRQAGELARWGTIFKDALETQVRDTVLRAIAERLSRHYRGPTAQTDKPLDMPSVIASIVNFMSPKTPRVVAIDTPKLVYDMIESFYADQSNFQYDWFISSKNLPAAVYNYLRTRDCFLDTFPNASLEVSLSYEDAKSGMYFFVCEVNWHPPNISFGDLPVQLPSGAEYRIRPHYMDPDLGSRYGSNWPKYPMMPEYTVSSATLRLDWDVNLCCFQAMLPSDHSRKLVERTNREPASPKIEETKFSAKIVTEFPDKVRFEQTTRYSIKLEIAPSTQKPRAAVRSSIPTYNFEPENASSTSDEAVDICLSSQPEELLIHKPHNWAATTPDPRRGSWLPSYTNTPLSKRGTNSVHYHMSVEANDCSSPSTASVERGADRLVPFLGLAAHSCQYSSWSYDNHTDEVASQVDELYQNRSPGQGVHEKTDVVVKDAGYEADSDSVEPLLPSRTLSPGNDKKSEDSGTDPFRDAKQYIKILEDKIARMEEESNRLKVRLKVRDSDEEANIEDMNRKCDELVEKMSLSIPDDFPEACESDVADRRRLLSEVRRTLLVENLRKNIKCNELWRDLSAGYFRGGASSNKTYLPNSIGITLPKKRKAIKQVPDDEISFRTPSTFHAHRLALDQFEHLDLELATKRQRLSERVDSGIDMRDAADNENDEARDDPLPSLANVRTGKLGEAFRTSSPTLGPSGWSQKLNDNRMVLENGPRTMIATKSRAYETNTSSKVMPALKKKGSVKRMVFPKGGKARHKLGYPTPPNSAASSSEVSPVEGASPFTTPTGSWANIGKALESLGSSPNGGIQLPDNPQDQDDANKGIPLPDQQQIIENYQQLLAIKTGEVKDKSSATYIHHETKRVNEDECKEYEKIFMNNSGPSSDFTAISSSSSSHENCEDTNEMEWNTESDDGTSKDLSEHLDELEIKME